MHTSNFLKNKGKSRLRNFWKTWSRRFRTKFTQFWRTTACSSRIRLGTTGRCRIFSIEFVKKMESSTSSLSQRIRGQMARLSEWIRPSRRRPFIDTIMNRKARCKSIFRPLSMRTILQRDWKLCMVWRLGNLSSGSGNLIQNRLKQNLIPTIWD